MLPVLDFSNAQINFDFSGSDLTDANFAFCNLTGSKFANAQLNGCHFDLSNWAGCDFSHATFNECYLSGVCNAHKAIRLQTVHGHGQRMNFETAIRPWWNRLLDWERIRAVGRLPFFTASSAALVIIPSYFYLVDIYNKHLASWRAALSEHGQDEIFVKISLEALNKLRKLPIPTLSLEALIAAVLLFIASGLFALLCPARIKQFSSEEWCHQLGHPILTYWPLAWRYPVARFFCASFYAVGGSLAIWVISCKLLYTAVYIWQNM
jgi:hypothetical protein